ncbi:UbiD family decarboxylase [Colletotrichum orchidophilum]|uniref:UbiD family decarboxylase n=1 Tax=Colletotrichum orchidophilum TaxID=1209926 RepID=A0A1G4BM28_9PEZI|nr:UbiD family decarboxylase [Colletotrichum orchidophilum]OHF02520.1 UbiD family decarboxylase [Colletotrichum orchidophilum]
MDPDVCRNCGHSGKHIDFLDARCAITERDDAERDKLQADAALDRARGICETSLSLMKRQMQELEDANEAIDALRAALTAAEDRRERVRRDLGTHGDVCLLARSNLEAAEEMAISAAGRYFEAGRAVTALEDREQLQKQSPRIQIEEAPPPLPPTVPMEEDDDDAEEEAEAAREAEDRRWKRSNERFCKWLRQSEAQRQIMKSSWTKLRVAERLAGENVNVDVADDDDEETARRNRVQEWTAARRLTDQLPPEEDPTMETEYLESEPNDSEETAESSELLVPAPAPVSVPAPAPAAHKTGVARRAPALRTRAKTGRAATTVTATAATQPAQTVPSSPVKGRNLRTARRVESQTRSEPTRPTTATTTSAKRVKREPKTTTSGGVASSAVLTGMTGATTTTAGSDGAAAVAGRPAARTRARTGKIPDAAATAAAADTPAAATRPQRATRRRSVRVQPYPQPGAQPRWK